MTEGIARGSGIRIRNGRGIIAAIDSSTLSFKVFWIKQPTFDVELIPLVEAPRRRELIIPGVQSWQDKWRAHFNASNLIKRLR